MEDVAFCHQYSQMTFPYLQQASYRTVLTPELTARNGERIPHMFNGKELCLFRYKYYEWNSSMHLAETILPWTSLWLHHYEIWHATGVWCGSKQEHPENDKPKEPEQTLEDMST